MRDPAVSGWGWVIDNLVIQGSSQENGQIPSTIDLAQNKPNPFPSPFNPVTTISFSIPDQSHVTLKIYDILGQEVITLIDDVKERGRYSVDWGGKNAQGIIVASGVYIYRVQSESESKSKRMVFVR